MNNLEQIAQLMKGRSPKEAVMQMVKSSKITDPTIASLIKYAQTGDQTNLMNLASQVFQQYGLNLNDELLKFLQMLK